MSHSHVGRHLMVILVASVVWVSGGSLSTPECENDLERIRIKRFYPSLIHL